MNFVGCTGWLPSDAAMRCTPGGVYKLTFEVWVKDSHGGESLQKCFIDHQELARRMEPVLTAGRGVIVQGELTDREWKNDHGTTSGRVREIRVLSIEVPNRSAPPAAEKPAAPASQPQPATR